MPSPSVTSWSCAAIFRRLQAAELRVNPRTCRLFQRRITFLGLVVSRESISTSPEKISTACDCSTPLTPKEVLALLGLYSFYRRSMWEFADVAKPLYKLIGTGKQFMWTEACNDALTYDTEASQCERTNNHLNISLVNQRSEPNMSKLVTHFGFKTRSNSIPRK